MRFLLYPLFCLLSIPTYAAIHILEHMIAEVSPESVVRKWCSLSQPKSFKKKFVINAIASLATLIGVGYICAFMSQAVPNDESFMMWNSGRHFADQPWAPFLIIIFWACFIWLLYMNKKAIDDGAAPINKLEELIIPQWVKSLFPKS